MNTKDILLVGAGILAGYILSGLINKSKNNAQNIMESEEPKVDQAKLADCTKKVEEQMATTEFKVSANFDLNSYKKESIDRCLKGGAM